MNAKQLKRARRKLETLRRRSANLRSHELCSYAKALGRSRDTKRGKEPTYISEFLPFSRPISIPDHPGALNRFTAENILDQLEQDIFILEEMLPDEE